MFCVLPTTIQTNKCPFKQRFSISIHSHSPVLATLLPMCCIFIWKASVSSVCVELLLWCIWQTVWYLRSRLPSRSLIFFFLFLILLLRLLFFFYPSIVFINAFYFERVLLLFYIAAICFIFVFSCCCVCVCVNVVVCVLCFLISFLVGTFFLR